MGIVGEVFDEKVQNQIRYRESNLADTGFSTHSRDKLKLNNTDSWLRLASSVNIQNPDPGEIPESRKKDFETRVAELTERLGVTAGDDLARRLVLYGGTREYTGTGFTTKAGINQTGTLLNNGAYGFGGANFGYRPMPGIQSAKVSYYNNGALAKADIQIICQNPEQLDLLELLYFRPGYSILLEWGHNTYLDADGEITTFDVESAVTAPFTEFFKSNTDAGKVAGSIVKAREKYAFNYEGFHGVITNFSWTFNSDASFTVTLKAVTQGSIIESLKVNTAGSKNAPSAQTSTSNDIQETSDSVEKRIVKRADESILFEKLVELTNAFRTGPNVTNFNSGNYDMLSVLLGSTIERILGKNSLIRTGDVLKIQYKVDSDEDTAKFGTFQHYIKLKTLFYLLEEFCSVYTKKEQPYVNINKAPTPMFTFPGQISANPGVCIIPPDLIATDLEVTTDASGFKKALPTFSKGSTAFILGLGADRTERATNFRTEEGGYFCANLMEVYVNFNEIERQVSSKENDKGETPLIALIQGILSSINKALGGINDFDIKFNQDTLSVEVYDKAAYRCGEKQQDKKEIYKFKPYGVTTSRGTTFRNLTFSSEVTNDFASFVAIGAQANGNQIGINSTAFSEFNIGLVDRVTPVKTTSKGTQPKISAEERFKNTLKTMFPLVEEMYGKIESFGPFLEGELKLSAASINTLEALNSTYAQYIIGNLTVEQKALTAPFFIPFKLQPTLTGISGIKLFQKYDIEQGILPYSYRDKVNFLILNQTHTIADNTWTTQLESLTVPAAKPGTVTMEWTPVLKSPPVETPVSGSSATRTLGPVQYDTLKLWFDRGTTSKNQIYIHHTAGGPSIEANIQWWNTTWTQKISTHWIIGPAAAEHIYEDKYWAHHLGLSVEPFTQNGLRYRALDVNSLSVELTSWGPLTKTSKGEYLTYTKRKLDPSQVVQPVDGNGQILKNGYRGYKYYHEYTDYQIDYLEELLFIWSQNQSSDSLIEGTSTKLDGGPITFTFSYPDLFPPANITKLSKKALRGEPGIYTHNSVRYDKTDVAPTPKMIAMLKRLEKRLSGDTRPQSIYDDTAARLKKYYEGSTSDVAEVQAVDLILQVVQNQNDWDRLVRAYSTDLGNYRLKGRIEYEYNGIGGNIPQLERLNRAFEQRQIRTQFKIQ